MKRKLLIIGVTLLTITGVIVAIIPGQFQTGSDFDGSMSVLNDMVNAINDENQTKIIRNGTVPTVIIGKQAGGFNGQDYGIKIAKPGIDVTKATNDQLAFTSANSYLMVAKTYTEVIFVPGNAGGTGFGVTKTYTHNLGIIPYLILTGTTAYGGGSPITYYVSATFEGRSVGSGSVPTPRIIDLNSFQVLYDSSTIDITYTITINIFKLS